MTLKAENISKTFGKNGLAHSSISASEGSFLCITGESGCGKTTLLNIISGMLKPDTGEVSIDGKSLYSLRERERIKLRNEKIGYMTQGNSLIPELTVWQNIVAPSELSGKKTDSRKVMELAQRLGIDKVIDSYPSELSGGEYRRSLLARVIVLDTPLLLVDEPTSNLDESSAAIVREVLYEEYKKGKGVVVVTHDREFQSYSPETFELRNGGGSIEQ
jgi:putative ABC transport system ATP-binding protein